MAKNINRGKTYLSSAIQRLVYDTIQKWIVEHKLNPRQADILPATNMSRPTLSKYLGELEKQGIVEFRGQKIHIVKPLI